jgi:hypothetical protein
VKITDADIYDLYGHTVENWLSPPLARGRVYESSRREI